MIWVVVAALNIVTILAFGEEVDPEKALWPLFFAFAVPAFFYGVGWTWDRFTRSKSGSDPDSF